MGWGPWRPRDDVLSFPPGCLGPHGEPVEVSVAPSGDSEEGKGGAGVS